MPGFGALGEDALGTDSDETAEVNEFGSFSSTGSFSPLDETGEASESGSFSSIGSLPTLAEIAESSEIVSFSSAGAFPAIAEAGESDEAPNFSSTGSFGAVSENVDVSESGSFSSTGSFGALSEIIEALEDSSFSSTGSFGSVSETVDVPESGSFSSSGSFGPVSETVDVPESGSFSSSGSFSQVSDRAQDNIRENALGGGRLGEDRLGGSVTLNSGFSSDEIAELDSTESSPCIFVRIDFRGDHKRYWSRPYDITISENRLGDGRLGQGRLGGRSYTGTDGAFLDIGPIEQTVDLETKGITIDLSGIDSDLRSIATSPEDYKDVQIKIMLGFLDSRTSLVSDPPTTIWRGKVNRLPMEISGNNGAEISAECVGPLSGVQRTEVRYWRDQDQKREYPDDDFFRNSGILKNQTIDVYGSEFITGEPIRYLSGDNTPQWKIHLLRNMSREEAKIDTGAPEISEDARNIVYGQARVANPITFASIDNNQLHIVMPLADHRCESLDQMWLSNNLIWEDGSFASGVDGNRWRVEFHDGNKDQIADSYLVANADGFTDSMRGRGVSYVAVSMDARIGIFSDGQKLRPEAVVSGKNDIYDPRNKTTGYTDNFGLCLRDYLLSDRFGPNVLGAHFGDTFDRLYRLSDSERSVSGGDRVKRFSMNGSFSTAEKRSEVLRNMLKQSGGYLAYIGGKIEVVGGLVTQQAISDIDENDITGPIEVDYGAGSAGNVNAIRGSFQREDDNFVPSDYTVEDDSQVVEDRGDAFGTYDLPFTKEEHTAKRLGGYALQQEVYQMSGSWEGRARLLQAPAGCRVQASNDFLSSADSDWDNKELLITGSTIDLSPEGITISQEFRETTDQEFEFTIQEDSQNSNATEERTTFGEGGPRERIQVREWEGVDLSPNGEKGDTDPRQVTVPAGGEMLVEAMGCWTLDANEQKQQTNDLEVVAYAENAAQTIKSTSLIFDEGEAEFNTNVEETVSLYIQNLGSDRIVGHGVIVFQVREE